VVLWALLVLTFREPIFAWLRGQNSYDRNTLREWLEEARTGRDTLPEMVDGYLSLVQRRSELRQRVDGARQQDPRSDLDLRLAEAACSVRRDEIHEHLRTLGVAPTKKYVGQLPLFPVVYRLEVRFDDAAEPPIVWDSGIPSEGTPAPDLEYRIHPGARAWVRYQMHAYHKQQEIEQELTRRWQRLLGLALAATVVGIAWAVLDQRREAARERQRLLAEQQVDQTRRRHAETERQLLQQRLATQAAEQKALELKSQLYASIGIMAGSYAHNIKNLLVRPNDLLRRCLEGDALSAEQATMLHEVQDTLGTVTLRLQQILRTVRRDPTRTEQERLDLNAVAAELEQTWRDLARDKWKLEIVVEAGPAGPVWVAGDASHLQQAVENLLFNARDAVFEMRNHLRASAYQDPGLDQAGRRQALIAAAAWRGRVALRTYRSAGEAVLEVADNGAGMSEEVRRRCTEPHFSTKRDNALYEGHSTGMGLGLSFVVTILEHHRARLEIESQPLGGTTFRVRFPAAAEEDRETGRQADKETTGAAVREGA
jgi:signal transduction histidine kinase